MFLMSILYSGHCLEMYLIKKTEIEPTLYISMACLAEQLRQ